MNTHYFPGGLCRRFATFPLFFKAFFASNRHGDQTQRNKTTEVNKGRRVLLEARSDTDEKMEATLGLLFVEHAKWLQRKPRTTQEVMSRFGVPMLLPEPSDDIQVQRISDALFDAGYTPFPKTQADPRWHWGSGPPTAAPPIVIFVQTFYSSWIYSKHPDYPLPIDDGSQVQRVERGLLISAKRIPYTEPGGSCHRGWCMEYKGTDIKHLGYWKGMGPGSNTSKQPDSLAGGHA